ncbi:MAG: hypothetical protein DCF29_15830 [Alphaproteobacteria bacterium]|nr:MAG: hypothetical protein DCF29_15830 [Alphaproteobacteria bacterium]
MSILLAAWALALQTTSAPPEAGWTWALYADTAPVVLANEIPDTPSLRSTLECEPGSSVARLTLYQASGMSGMTRVSAGDSVAMTESAAGRAGSVKLALRTDHPVFTAFAREGSLSMTAGETRRTLEIPQAHLAKLRRFAELCSG